MALKTLSPFPYYGGKAKMASLISDMLDYKNTDIYIEPFGGACRVLLNKPRHMVEIYSDASAGLCAFMKAMSSPDTAYELIDRLYQTEYSPEQFYNALVIRNKVEDHFLEEFRREAYLSLQYFTSKYESDHLESLKTAVSRRNQKMIQSSYEKVIENNFLDELDLTTLESYKRQYDRYMSIFNIILLNSYKERLRLNIHDYYNSIQGPPEEHETQVNKSLDIKTKRTLQKKSLKEATKDSYAKTFIENLNVDIDDMNLAVATYIIYSQSRDGMGKAWSPNKYHSTDHYHSQLSRLYDVAERLNGVEVFHSKAAAFLLESSYLNNPRAMIYCDPSYLSPNDEKKNLGEIYKSSFTKEDHKLFLKVIQKAKCKLLVSNYDVPLYNKYLTEEEGWKRIEYETTTSVSNKIDNQRIEVLWYKY